MNQLVSKVEEKAATLTGNDLSSMLMALPLLFNLPEIVLHNGFLSLFYG